MQWVCFNSLPTAYFVLQTNVHFLSSHSRMSQYLVKYVFCGFMKGVILGIFFYWLFPQRGGDEKLKQVGEEPLKSGGLFSGSVMLYGGGSSLSLMPILRLLLPPSPKFLPHLPAISLTSLCSFKLLFPVPTIAQHLAVRSPGPPGPARSHWPQALC